MTTLADTLFDHTMALLCAEGDLCDLLIAVLGKGNFSDYTFDYYDRSIEIYGVKSFVALTAVFSAGFDKIWLHSHDLPRLSHCACKLYHKP